MLLREIAYSRAGDKGNRLTLSVIAYDIRDFPAIERAVTAERVVVACAVNQSCRDGLQDVIAHIVAILVVDFFEMIKINEHHRQVPTVPFSLS